LNRNPALARDLPVKDDPVSDDGAAYATSDQGTCLVEPSGSWGGYPAPAPTEPYVRCSRPLGRGVVTAAAAGHIDLFYSAASLAGWVRRRPSGCSRARSSTRASPRSIKNAVRRSRTITSGFSGSTSCATPPSRLTAHSGCGSDPWRIQTWIASATSDRQRVGGDRSVIFPGRKMRSSEWRPRRCSRGF